MNKVGLIMRKEWAEIRTQPLLWGGMALLPVVCIIATAVSLGNTSVGSLNGLPAPDVSNDPQLAGLSQPQIFQMVMELQLRMFFLLMPLLISAIIPAHSIVGEKTSRTLEPLLATPVSTRELLLGKCLISLILSTACSWLGGFVFALEIWMFAPPAVFATINSPGWWTALILVIPAMSLLPIAVSVLISSKFNDPRTAQQFASLVGIALGAIFYVILGFAVSSPWLALLTAVGLALIGALALQVASALFQRETILTRWS